MLVLASTFLQRELYQVSLVVFLPFLSHSHQRTNANSSTMSPGCYLWLQNAHPSFRDLATNDLPCLRENSKNSGIYFVFIYILYILYIYLYLCVILYYFLAVVSKKNWMDSWNFCKGRGCVENVGKMSSRHKTEAEGKEGKGIQGELG